MCEERRDRRQLDIIEKHLENMMLTENQIQRDQTAMNHKLDILLSTGTPAQVKALQDLTAKLKASEEALNAANVPSPVTKEKQP
jgi:hypothetical protein